MKLKSVEVITLCVLGCSAAFAQGSATLGFTSAGGLQLYCNYLQIKWGGYQNLYAGGYDNLQGACFVSNNASLACAKVNFPAASGSPVTGPAYWCADSIIDAFGGYYSGESYALLTQTKPSTRLHHYGWAGYLGFDGYEFLDNYGYLSASYPGHAPEGKPVLGETTRSGAPQSIRTQTITE